MAPRWQPPPPNSLSFSAASVPPYNLLSNFFGGAELEYMAARFEHDALKQVLLDTFANCTVEEFVPLYTALHPTGRVHAFLTKQLSGVIVPARGILGRFAGTAVISSGQTGKNRMRKLKMLAGLSQEEEVKTNTARILSEKGVAEDAPWKEKEEAINAYNEELMRQCLRNKFRAGHRTEDGTEYRTVLLQTRDMRLRESIKGKRTRWSANGDDDGLLGKMLMKLRDEIRKEQTEAGIVRRKTWWEEEGEEEKRKAELEEFYETGGEAEAEEQPDAEEQPEEKGGSSGAGES